MMVFVDVVFETFWYAQSNVLSSMVALNITTDLLLLAPFDDFLPSPGSLSAIVRNEE